jgi:enoyl-CoA hydratase
MKCFDLSVADKIATLSLARPDTYNAMDAAFWNGLPKLVRELDQSAQARVLLIASQGKHFSSGMDLSAFAGFAPQGDPQIAAESFRNFVTMMQQSFSCLEQARFPVIAAVQGGCIGAGVDMVAACDIRYATEDAFFQIQETNIAMTADVGTFPRLCKLIPDGWMRELAFTGKRLGAAKAKELGLVNEVFPTQEAMLAHARETAAEIAGKSPLAVFGAKRMINYARDHSTADALDYIATWQAGMFSAAHIAEAFAARAEKRPGAFPDLAAIKTEM